MLRYLPSTGFLCLLCWLLAIKPATAQTKYEAEGPTASRVPNNTNTINGIGFAENLTQVGTGVTFSVTVPATGMYTVTSRYAAARAYAETMSVYVNGVDVTQAQFASTASWASWNTQQVTVYLLANTTNTIAYKYDSDDSGWINLDYILVNPAVTPGYLPGSAAAANLPSEVSVDKFTGTATVDIPLYTVAIPGVQLPVALHYAATGVQVNDAGGEVGMNWSLQAGLSIQRQVRDLPDDILRESGPEKRYGWLHYANPMAGINNTPDPPASFSTGCTSLEQLALNQLSALGSLDHQDGGNANLPFSMYDTEPDIYTYAIPGYSGKFVFDNAHAVRLIPYAPVRIEPQIAAADALVTADNSDCSYNVNKGEVTGFTITTPEGTVYTFNCLNRVQKGLDVMFPRTPGLYAQRQFWNIVTDRTATPNYSRRFSMTMTTGWLATEIKTPAAIVNPTLGVVNLATGNRGVSLNTIKFYYTCNSAIAYEPSTNWLSRGNTGQLVGAGEPSTKALSIPLLTDIKSPTATVTLTWGETSETNITSLTVKSPLASDALIKSYTFDYFHTASDFNAGYHWYKPWIKCDRQKDDSRRSFLVGIQLLRGVSNLPLYTFKYDQVQEGSEVILPPLKSINKDYWGFANNNEASTGLPKLYIYPLLGFASPAPSAPYRLYPKLDYPGGGIVLDGADRRPTTNLRLALTGTLTAMAFPTGGKAVFEYEQHRFYDPVLQQTQPAGGLRVRTIRLLDPITKAESRRDYSYQTASGTSSGVLLHWPHLAFALPVAGTSQWTDVTVRSLEELAPDPFESRNIGYSQVTEQVAGKGQVAITFSVPAGADDTSSPADAVSGLPAWQRPLYGLARQASNNSCPSVAPLQAGSELYPFTPATNYDFCRGLPLTVQYRAEPTNTTTPGALVSQESYTYKYTSVVPAGATDVGGLRYEQFGNTGTPFYVYGKYKLLTDFLYTLRRQVVQLPVAGGATNQTITDYSYTSRGQLASKTVQGSDGTLTRTRYKYLADYAPLPTGVVGELLTMRQRLYDDQVSGDAVETISEFRPAGATGPLSYTGATLQTFTTNTALTGISTVTTPTYPARLLRWQPAQPTASTSYDSVRVVNNALRIPSTMREVSSVLATDASLSPLATRTVAGRQLMGQHLGYAGSLPVIQIANATAAEVIFSDFEADEEPRAYTFERVRHPTTSHVPYAHTMAARTGEAGLVIDTGEGLNSTLPASSSTQYRLVFWAKAPSTATSTVTVSSGSTTAFTQTVSHNAQWQRYDLLLPANLVNPTSYQVKITAGAKVYFDDVYLAPTQALVASTTYRPAVGKTSETDARGRTTYYEYGSTGDLALVRDHNQAIVHQYEKVIPSRVISSGLSYTTSGSMLETEPVTFTAVVGLSGALQYKWDFGDGASVGYPAGGSAANQIITHTYPVLGYNKNYTVRLYVMSQGIEYLYAREISISMQPIQLTSCTAGVISVDDCRQQPDELDMSCASAPNGQTTFIATPDIPGAYSYSWESIDPTDQFSTWNQVTSSSTPTNTPLPLTVLKNSTKRYRCRVSNAHQEVISEDFAVIHYRSCP